MPTANALIVFIIPGGWTDDEGDIVSFDIRDAKAKVWRQVVAFIDQVQEELKSMEEMGTIEVSKNVLSSPLVTVR